MSDWPANHCGASPPLSDAGRQRRAMILRDAAAAMTQRHERRRRRRRAAGAAMFVAAVVVIGALAEHLVRAPAPPMPDEPGYVANVPPKPTPAAVIQVVQTTPGIAERLAVRSTPRHERLSNGELVDLLAAVNRPAGLIEIDGSVRLTRYVADAPQNENDDDRIRSPSS